MLLIIKTNAQTQLKDSIPKNMQKDLKAEGNMPIDSIINNKIKALKKAYLEKETTQNKLRLGETNNSFSHNNQKFIIQSSFGLGYRLGGPKNLADMYNVLDVYSLYTGKSISFLGVFRVTKLISGGNLRLGIRYNKFSTGEKDFSNTSTAIFLEDLVKVRGLTYIQKNDINFIGIAIMMDKFYGKNQKHWFNTTFSLGHIAYKNTTKIIAPGGKLDINLSAENLGFDMLIGYRYFIFKNIGIGVDLGFLISSIINIKYSDSTGQSDSFSLNEQYSISTFSPQIGITAMF